MNVQPIVRRAWLNGFLRRHGLLPGILFLALALRVYDLGRIPLWYDEAMYCEPASHFDLGFFTSRDLLTTPFYYALLTVWEQLGTSDVWVRLLAVLCGVAMVWVAWLLGNRLANQRGAWLAAFIIAISPLLVFYSRDAKMYSLVALLELAVTYLAMTYGSSDGSKRHLILYVCSAIALIHSHLVSPLYLAPLNLLYLVLYARSVRKTLVWMAAQAVVLGASVPYLLAQRHHANLMTERFFWAPRPQPRSLYVTACNMLAGYATLDWVRMGAVVIFGGLIVLAILFLKGKRKDLLLLVGVACAQSVLLYLCSRQGHLSFYVDRYLIGCSAPLLIAGACGLAAIPWRWARTPIILAIVTLCGLSLKDLYAYSFSPNQLDHLGVYKTYDAHGMRDLIRAEGRPGDVVWHVNWTTLAQLRWYTPEYEHILADMAGRIRAQLDDISPRAEQAYDGFFPTEIERAQSAARRVWLVMPENQPEIFVPFKGIAAWLDARAERIVRRRLGGPCASSSLSLYDFSGVPAMTDRELREDSVEMLPPSAPLKGYASNADEISLALRRGISEGLQHDQVTFTATNASGNGYSLFFEATVSDVTCLAAEFDRVLQEHSRWELRPYADFQQSRLAMYARVNAGWQPLDAARRTFRVPPGVYRIFVERLASGTRNNVPVGLLSLRVGGQTYHAVGKDPAGHGGWSWLEIGSFEQTAEGEHTLIVQASDPEKRPEASVSFSRVVFCSTTRTWSGSLAPPVVQRELLALSPNEIRHLPIVPVLESGRMDVMVAGSLNSATMWMLAGGS